MTQSTVDGRAPHYSFRFHFHNSIQFSSIYNIYTYIKLSLKNEVLISVKNPGTADRRFRQNNSIR